MLEAGQSNEAYAAYLETTFAGLRSAPIIVVAVSGGVDSLALMHLIADWQRLRPTGPAVSTVDVVTVDHRLRSQSRQEAEQVGVLAAQLGLAHTILTWTAAPPATGVQASAREARYRLLASHASAQLARRGAETSGPAAVVTAHTEDDQAETLLMRLARGSGVDGLAGMRAVRRLAPNVDLHRPLLDTAKSALAAHLSARGVRWVEDPSNENPTFERVRWRRQRMQLDAIGLTHRALATSARRAGEAAALIDQMIIRLPGFDDAVRVSPFGFVDIDRVWFMGQPSGARLRLIGSAIRVVGGQAGPVPLGQLEAHERLLLGDGGFTLHGAQVDLAADRIRLLREVPTPRPPDTALPSAWCALPLAPGETAVWDHRFEVRLAAHAPDAVTIGPLRPAGLQEVEASGRVRPAGVPARVLWTLPALCRGDAIVAVPHLGYGGQGSEADLADVRPHRYLFA